MTTSNFMETSISKNAKRQYSPIEDLAAFENVISAFEADTTMNFTKKEASTAAYKGKVEYSDVNGEDKGYVSLNLEDKTAFEAMISYLKGTEAAEYAAGVDGRAVNSPSMDTWSRKYSCAIGIGDNEDTFTITIGREFMYVNGFAKDETLTVIETWADTIPALGGEPA